MKTLEEIFDSNRTISEIIDDLKITVISDIPSWETILKDYDPKQHFIYTDPSREKKVMEDGSIDIPAKIILPLEKLLTKRITDYTFAIPVKRVYSGVDNNETRQNIVNAIESIYKHARIDTINKKRGVDYYAACQFFTYWYAVKKDKPHSLYGFPTPWKVYCKTFSPMDGVKFYPLFDDYDDLIAMSYQFKKKVVDKEVIFFECFTADKHYSWKQVEGAQDWEVIKEAEPIVIGKIPGVYQFRHKPVWDELQDIRNDLERTISNNSDTIDYNHAPLIKVAGSVEGNPKKSSSRRIVHVKQGGDVSYVSWNQATEASKSHVDVLLRLYFMLSQMPDVSFENMIRLGSIGYDARKTLFTDAFLRIGEESGAWVETFERELNVIKALLCAINPEFTSEIDNIDVEHVITPFIQEDIDANINRWMKACGGKPIVSQEEAVENAGLSHDTSATMEKLNKEQAEEMSAKMASMFSAE